jgi:hypothetical protein
MELALNGIPTGRMTEPEFQQWARYARRRLLPMQRMEIYLAQIAMYVVKAAGGEGKIADFMIQTFEDEPVEEPEDELEAAKEAFGFAPRNRKVADGA